MLKRLYVDNFRCLVNFDVRFDRLSLLLGLNGSGKTTLFDVFLRLREFLGGARVLEVFPSQDLTRWDRRLKQTFELELATDDGVYLYHLVIDHDESGRKARVFTERLDIDGKPLFVCQEANVQLYRDDHSEGPAFSLDWTQSGLASIMRRDDNQLLHRFREHVARFLVIALVPQMMTGDIADEQNVLARDGANFGAWYRFLSQEYQDKVSDLANDLQEVLEGFRGFRLVQAGGEHRIFRVGFATDESSDPHFYRLDELSHGERVLIALYTIINFSQDAGYTLLIDEPANFVALAEIQPWLVALRELCEENGVQAILTSHHPELIDYLGDKSIFLERVAGGPTRIRELMVDKESPLLHNMCSKQRLRAGAPDSLKHACEEYRSRAAVGLK